MQYQIYNKKQYSSSNDNNKFSIEIIANNNNLNNRNFINIIKIKI